MTFHYLIYGLRLKANRSIPGLYPIPQSAKTDLQVCLGQMPADLLDLMSSARLWHISPEMEEGEQPVVIIHEIGDGRFFRLVYSDNTVFVVDRAGTQIWADWPHHLTLEDTATYLLGPVLGFVLVLRGIVCLHAATIDVGGQAIALVGESGAGKSTTAAAFAQLGYPVLGDDVLALVQQGKDFMAQPAYPHIRLWPESVKMFYETETALPLLTPN